MYNRILEKMKISMWSILEELTFVLPVKAVSVQIKYGINPIILVILDSVSLLGSITAHTTIFKGIYFVSTF